MIEEKETEQEFTEVIEEEISEIKLTGTQKILLIVIGVVFYFLFVLLFFPYSSFIRYLISKIDYTELNIDFNSILLKDLYFTNEKDIFFTTDAINIKTKLWNLINKKIDANVILNSGSIKIKEINSGFKNMDLIIKIDNSYDEPLSRWSGEVILRFKEISLEDLWGILKNFSLPEEQKLIKNLNIRITLDKGNYSIKNFTFDNPLFKIQIMGNGTLSNTIENSTVNGSLCLMPDSNIEEKNPAIYGIYLSAGGSLGGQLCIGIEGNLSNIKFLVNKNP